MRVLFLAVLLAGSVSGCGGDARRARALDAIDSTRTALVDLESRTSGSERPAAVADALDRANVRLEETEHAYDLWGGSTGRLAYERMAACLAASLDTLREALVAAGIEVTMELEAAEATLGTTTEHECAHAAGGD
jgi:hypothetical protein